MGWLKKLKRDPVPWLLDPVNPSARLLTLRAVFQRPERELAREQEALLAWEPVQTLMAEADENNFWGRGADPYFGGPLGTFGTLYALMQARVPPFPRARQASAALLSAGQAADGRFALRSRGEEIWLCYTGMALQTLWYFGLGGDPRTDAARAFLVQKINQTAQLTCPLVGERCIHGESKALAGLLSIPAQHRLEEDSTAIVSLAKQLLAHSAGKTVQQPGTYPRYYNSDLIELVYLLARAGQHEHPQFQNLLRELLALQTKEGHWRKGQGIGGYLDVEPDYQPSRWLTWQVVSTLLLVYGQEGNPYASN